VTLGVLAAPGSRDMTLLGREIRERRMLSRIVSARAHEIKSGRFDVEKTDCV
jgi:hypothetical protein